MPKCESTSCIQLVRTAGYLCILDTKAPEKGPIQVLSVRDYRERLDQVIETGDVRLMFDSDEQYRNFDTAELNAFRAYAIVGRLDLVANHETVTAFTDLRDLQAPKGRQRQTQSGLVIA